MRNKGRLGILFRLVIGLFGVVMTRAKVNSELSEEFEVKTGRTKHLCCHFVVDVVTVG